MLHEADVMDMHRFSLENTFKRCGILWDQQ